MHDQTLRELAGLHRLLSRADEVFAVAEAPAPARSEGSDPTGTIHAVVGRDGVPEAIHVEHGWRRAVGSAGFADAVAQACDAAQAKAREAAQPSGEDPESWSDRLRQALTGEESDRHGDRSSASNVQALFAPAAPGSRAREPEVYVEEALRYIGAADARLDAPRLAAGAAAGGRLRVALEPTGSLSCEFDPDWLARQEAEDLTETFNRALAAARAELYANTPERKSWQR